MNLENKRLYMGIDPGVRGAFALVDEEKPNEIFATILMENLPDMWASIVPIHENIVHCAIEKNSYWNMHKKQISELCYNLGWIDSLVCGLQLKVDYVPAGAWQDHFLSDKDDPMEKELLVPKSKKEQRNRAARRRNQLKRYSLDAAREYFQGFDVNDKNEHGKSDALWLAMYSRAMHLKASESDELEESQ